MQIPLEYNHLQVASLPMKLKFLFKDRQQQADLNPNQDLMHRIFVLLLLSYIMYLHFAI